MSIGLSLGAFADGFANGLSMTGGNGRKKPGLDRANNKTGPLDLGAMTDRPPALGATPPPPDGGTGVSAAGERVERSPRTQGGLAGLLDRVEGGGDYNTLFKFSNRDGGAFAGTKLTDMTLGDVYRFTTPSGEYGQWVAANNGGVVATPVGKNQFVGSTLRTVAKGMGLPDDTPFNADTQDAMFNYHARNTLAGASTMAGKRAALRGQWVGLKSVPDSELDNAILQFESFGNTLGARPPIS